MPQKLKQTEMKCPTCGGSGEKWVDDAIDHAGAAAEALGNVPPCPACEGTGMVPGLDPEKERQNGKTVMARIGGAERCLDVWGKIEGQKYSPTSRLWLGTLPYMTNAATIAAECKRQWPIHFKIGIRVCERPGWKGYHGAGK